MACTAEIEFATLVNGDKVPRYLYRYLPINEKLFTSIKESYLWFTDPQIFNDPYDCNLRLTNSITDQTIEKYLKTVNYLKNKSNDEELAERIKYYINNKDEVVANLDGEMRRAIEACGVCCFSQKPDILLMWSHYAEKHAGICLKFDIKADADLFKQANLIKVKYLQEYPRFDFMEYLINNQGNPMGKELLEFVVGMKSTDWCYESEVRLVLWKGKQKEFRGKVGFKKEALVGLNFGYKTDADQIKNVIDKFGANGYNLSEIQKSILKDKDFGLVFDSLDL